MDQKYDAFISYKHGDLDGAIALKLQTLLEHLRVPSSSKNKVKKIERIFLDTGELSSSADFVQQVESALKGAEWLIVLCSPGSKASPWCKLEIDTFLKYHDMSHILLLLTEGEPDDVFPDRLLAEEMNSLHILAADARGKTKKEALKNLKKEAVYKLAATMLGLTYDDLKQRRKTYVMQRVAAASAAAFVVLACFTAYIIYQSGQISLNFNKAQKNQARYLTTVSNNLLTAGDRDTAILTANAITPEQIEDGPLVPEQYYSLNRALGSFKARNEYLPTAKITTGNSNGKSTSYSVTQDQAYACTLHDDKFTALSNAAEEVFWTLPKQDAKKLLSNYLLENPEMLLPDNISDDSDLEKHIRTLTDRFEFEGIAVYKGSQVFLYSHTLLFLVDIESQSLVYCHEICNDNIYVSGNTLIIGQCSQEMYKFFVYNAESFELLHTWTFEDLLAPDDDQMPDIKSVTLNPDGTEAVVSFYVNELSAGLGKKAFTGTFLLDLKTGEKEMISEYACASVAFTDKNTVAMITETPVDEPGFYSDFDNHLPEQYYYCLYDIENAKSILSRKWKNDVATSFSFISKMPLTVQGETKQFVLYCLKNDLILVDASNESVVLNLFYHNEIINIAKNGDTSFFVVLSNGKVQEITLNDFSESYYYTSMTCLDTEIKSYSYLDQTDKFLFFTGNHVIYCQNNPDPYYQNIVMPDVPGCSVDTIEYVRGADSCFRVALLSSTEGWSYDHIAFSVYKTGEAEPLYSWEASDGSTIQDLQFREVDGHLIAVCVESCPGESFSYTYIMHKLDVSTGKELAVGQLGEYCSFNTMYAFSKDFSRVVLNNSGSSGLTVLDISGNEITEVTTNLADEYSVSSLVTSGDGGVYLFLGRKEDNTLHFMLLNSETEELTELPLTEENGLSDYCHVVPGITGPWVFLQLNETASYLLNTKNPDTLIPLGENINDNVAFFDEDRYLIYTCNAVINLYDIEKQEVVTSFEDHSLDIDIIKNASIETDGSDCFFALNNSNTVITGYTNDEGILLSPMYTFYVDKNKKIYLYAKSTATYISPAGREISMSFGDSMVFTSLYNYQELCQHAEDLLGDKKLSDAELQSLLTAD